MSTFRDRHGRDIHVGDRVTLYVRRSPGMPDLGADAVCTVTELGRTRVKITADHLPGQVFTCHPQALELITAASGVFCRICGRPIALSPASHIWWATDGSEPDCPHEPRDADSDGEGPMYPDVVVASGGLASPWDYGPYSHNRPAGRPRWKWA